MAVVGEVGAEAFKKVWNEQDTRDASCLLGKASEKNTTVTRVLGGDELASRGNVRLWGLTKCLGSRRHKLLIFYHFAQGSRQC